MRFLRRSLIGLFLLSVTAGLLFVAASTLFTAIEERMTRENRTRPVEERVFSANVVPVSPTRIAPILTAFGEVRSTRSLEVRATTAGTIVELSPNFEEGGQVEEGELLVAIDPQDAQSALDVARTDVVEAEATLREAERAMTLATDELTSAEAQAALQSRALERARNLADRGVGTEANVEAAEISEAQAFQSVLTRRQAVSQAESRLDQARTALARRQIELAEAERRLSETQILAEFSGVLSEVVTVEGGLVAQNERLADLIDPRALEISFRLSTSQYARLLDPDGRLLPADVEAILDVLGADLTATGRITRESASVAEGQTGRLLFAALDGAAGFRPGDFVTVRVLEPEMDNVALLPATALNGSRTVLALGADDRLEALPVTVLRQQGDDVIVSAAGLQGREIIAERSPVLGVGIRVRPIRPDASIPQRSEEELVELTPERRAALIAFIETNASMPAEAKARVLAQLAEDRVPARVVARIESNMGG